MIVSAVDYDERWESRPFEESYQANLMAELLGFGPLAEDTREQNWELQEVRISLLLDRDGVCCFFDRLRG